MLTIHPNNGYEKYLFDQAFKTQTPISRTFELLPVCNMDCSMCYIRMSPEEMRKQGQMLRAKDWLRIGEEAAKKGTLFLLLTGGEPLLHPDFGDIYKGLRSLGICININTNGTLITEALADLWANNVPRRVNISLYGSNNKIYEKFCRNPQGFTQIMKGIRLLKERNIPVKLNCTLTPWNREDMDHIIEISEQLEIPVSMPTYLFPPGRKAGWHGCAPVPDGYRLSPEDAAKEQVKALYRAYHTDPDYAENIQGILDEIHERENWLKTHNGDCMVPPPGGFLCSAGVSSFWVNWKGELTPCGMMQTPVSNLMENDFEHAWETIKTASARVFTSTECFNCKYREVCQTCAASACIETGHPGNKVPYHCQMSRAYERMLQEHLKEIEKEKL